MQVEELLASKYVQPGLWVTVTRDGRSDIYPSPCPAVLKLRMDAQDIAVAGGSNEITGVLLLDVEGIADVTEEQRRDLSGWNVYNRRPPCGTWVIAMQDSNGWRVDSSSRNLDIKIEDAVLGVEHD